jgi:gliding motility-associated-like protein
MVKNLQKAVVLILFFLAVTPFELVAQTAAFTYDHATGCPPSLVVTFTDQSTPGANRVDWDFGNGNSTFRDQNTTGPVKASYPNPGVYKITLTLSTGSSVSHTITVFNNPKADFTITPPSACAGQTVLYNSTSTAGSAPIKTYFWRFGDGASQTGTSPAASHIYTAKTYPVGLDVTDTNQCSSDTVKNNVIVQGPVASFTTNPVSTTQCIPPLAVTFNNTSTVNGTATYSWDFGDGSAPVTTSNAQHTYTSKGQFSPKLTVTQGACQDVSVHTNSVVIQNISVDFAAKATACINENIAFAVNVNPAPDAQAWNFGDKGTAIVLNPGHAYTNAGTYGVTLAAKSGTCADSIKKNIVITSVTAKFGIIPASCNPLQITFSDSSNNAVSYLWDFGDTTANSTAASPVHLFKYAGPHTVTMTVTNATGCKDKTTRAFPVVIQRTNFISNIDRGCAPLPINFNCTNTPLSNYKSFAWDFGDGSTGSGAALTHTFLVAGVYSVKLVTTTNANCPDSLVKVVRAGNKPVGKFTVAPTTVCYHKPVNFTDASIGTVNNWLYLYKDGIVDSLVQNPKHIYADTGTFKTRMVALHNGCPDTSQITAITILPPKAQFSFKLNCTYTVALQDQSVKADSIVWKFGDGATDVSNKNKILTHTYASRGSKTIQLDAYKGGCKDSMLQTFIITDPKAIITKTAKTGCYPLIDSLSTNLSQDANTYKWRFGTGDSSKLPNPVYTYLLPKKYFIQLTITDINGCLSTAKDSVTVFGPIPKFGADKTQGCAPLQVVFSDSSAADSAKVKWLYDFGDGTKDSTMTKSITHTFKKPGSYSVSMSLTDKNGCTQTMLRSNYIQSTFPVPAFAADTFSCRGIVLNLNAGATNAVNPTYTWNFGEQGASDTSTTLASIQHSYSKDNLYTVRLVVKDKNGCKDSIKKQIRILKPIAAFTDSVLNYKCGKENIQFKDLSTGLVNSWSWDFGDGGSANGQNPNYFYIGPGKYSVKLVVKNNGGCTDTSLAKDLVVVPGPIGSFTFDPASGCIPFHANFTAKSLNSNTYTWDFGDGNVTTTQGQTIDHTYIKNITITPILLLGNTLPNGQPCNLPAKNLTGSVSALFTVGVHFTPNVVTVSDNEIYFLNPVVSNAKGKPVFTWQPTQGLSCITCQRPGVKTSANINYALTVKDSLGCLGRDTVYVSYVPCMEHVKIPDVISPNGDGLNDEFSVFGACYKSDYSLSIYNRWGELLFVSQDYKEKWDGRTKSGIMVADGIYFYLLQRGGSLSKGNVTVIRE